ncbi:MAG: hypothetical protein R2699_13590 [Acidimicrobiales bacterium]
MAAARTATAAIHFAMVLTHGGEDLVYRLRHCRVGAARSGRGAAVAPGASGASGHGAGQRRVSQRGPSPRTSGLPFGLTAGVAEAAGFVDIASVVLEGLAIVLAMALLSKPALGATWGQASWVMASLPVLAVVAVTTAAIVSPSATDHGGAGHDHGESGGEHDHGDVAWQPLDYATQRQLTDELALARAATEKYLTVADLKAAGGVSACLPRATVRTTRCRRRRTDPGEGVRPADDQGQRGRLRPRQPADHPVLGHRGHRRPGRVMYVVFQDEEPGGVRRAQRHLASPHRSVRRRRG